MPDERVETLRGALECALEGAGAFSRDPLEHADNCIEDMKGHIRDAIAILATAHITPGPDGQTWIVMLEAREAAQHWYEKNEMVADGRPFPGCAEAAQRRHFASRRAVLGIATALLGGGVERAGTILEAPCDLKLAPKYAGWENVETLYLNAGDRFVILKREAP